MGSFVTVPFEGEHFIDNRQCLYDHSSEKCTEYSCQDDIIRRTLYIDNNNTYLYYSGQCGMEQMFDLYMDLCGIEVYDDNSSDFIWDKLKHFLDVGYLNLHRTIMTSELFIETIETSYITVVLELGKISDDSDLQAYVDTSKLCEFAKLVTEYLAYPKPGESLFCTIEKGDLYTMSYIKFPFMKAVFDEFRISTKKPAMATSQARLKTFKRYEEEEMFDSGLEDFVYDMVEAGFYRTTNKKLSQCFECGGLVNIEKENFNPWDMHARKHPLCPYVQKIKGQSYIDNARRKWKEEINISPKCVLMFENRVHGPDINNDEEDFNNDSDNWLEGSDYFSD